MSGSGKRDTLYSHHREFLDRPTPDLVRQVFSRLPRRGSIQLVCDWHRRRDLLDTLVSCGAFAIRVDPMPALDQVRISALKGKDGPCYETGRTATYLGAAAAVMDDDVHLIAGSIRVCEKTAELYTLSTYQQVLHVTAGHPEKVQRLDTDPIPFDCSTFGADADKLAAALPAQTSPPTVAVFYPGPFSLLVLKDGSIVRRGVPTRIASELVADLQQRDGLLLLTASRTDEALPAQSYAASYAALGPACLLNEPPCISLSTAPRPEPIIGDAELSADALGACHKVPHELRQRLDRLLEHRESYFILTGSDPRETHGCCPSTIVGAANQLVEVGLLSSYRMPVPSDGCTTTIYAFAGEILETGGQPTFTVRDDIRRQASAELTRQNSRTKKIGSLLLRGGLILLLAISLVLAAHRASVSMRTTPEDFAASMQRVLGTTADDDRLFVCFFQGWEHCDACNVMGKLCRQTVDELQTSEAAEPPVFREIRFDEPENLAIKRELELGTSSVGLVQYENGTPRKMHMLWVHFGALLFLGSSVGFDTPTPGLMRRRPRPANQRIIDLRGGMQITLSGIMLAVAAIASQQRIMHINNDPAMAQTMALIVFAIAQSSLALSLRFPEVSIFRRETLSNPYPQFRHRLECGARCCWSPRSPC